MNKSKYLVLLSCLFLLGLISGAVMADDGRINPPPYHFGGDALYCNENEGCTLLSPTGEFLWNWSQDEVATATNIVDETGQNTLVGEGVGTYGPAELWAIPSDEANGDHRLCLFAYDEWGKRNDMCFTVTAGWVYIPIRLAGPVAAEIVEPPADCSMWQVKNWVSLKVNIMVQGPITSINEATGQVTFTNQGLGGHGESITAGCDEVESLG